MKRLFTVVSLVIVMFGVVGPMVQTANAGSIIRLSRSPDRSQYEASDILMIECEMDVDGTTRWVVENFSTGQIWTKHETGQRFNQERLVLSELVSGSGNQTIRVTCEGRYGDGGWEGPNVARASMEFSVNASSGGSSPSSGGMNFQGYCQYLGYDRADTGNDSNAFTWVCVDGNRESGMDLYDLCSWQYGGQLPYPGLDDPYNPYDWACYRDSHQVAQMTETPVENNPEPQQSEQPQQQNESSGGNPDPSQSDCPSYQSHLAVEMIAIVNVDAGGDLKVRSNPGTENEIRDRLHRGDLVTVIGGPSCSDGYVWWEIGYNGQSGWSAEVGEDGEYYLIPNGQELTSQPAPSSNQTSTNTNTGGNTNTSGDGDCSLAGSSRLSVGGRGQVTVADGVGSHLQQAPAERPDLFLMPEGYSFDVIGGPVCDEGFRWWQLRIADGTTGWTADGDSQNDWLEPISGSSENNNHIVNFDIVWFGDHHYQVQLNTRTCAIINGSEVVTTELNRLLEWSPNVATSIPYFWPNDGDLEDFRHQIEITLTNGSSCQSVYYLVGDLYMDTSGLGNIVFGFYMAKFSVTLDEIASNVAQGLNRGSFLNFWDNPDDRSQRVTGRLIANAVSSGESLTSNLVEQLAVQAGLR